MAIVRHRTALIWAIAAGAVAMIGYDGYQLWQARRFSQALSRGDSFESYQPDTAHARFARAYMLHQAGRLREALAVYSAVDANGDSGIGPAVKFNLANLYIQYAHELGDDDAGDLALPLLELAKENYREVLRTNDQAWDAKHNLEIALALLPDAEEQELADEQMPEHSSQAAGTIEAYEELP